MNLSLPAEEDGSGGEESGSGCDSPSCEEDRDIYFSTPAPFNPRVVKVVHKEPGSENGAPLTRGSAAMALGGLVLALLLPHWR